MKTMLRALMIEDSEDDACILERALRQGGFELQTKRITTAEQLKSTLKEGWDVILSDYIIPGFGALEALKILKEGKSEIPFIIISGKIEEETAVYAMKAGAHDFITKGNLARLVPVVCRELAEAQVRLRHRSAELARLKSEERYRHLAESITDVFFALDLNLCCTYWNKAAEKLTGIYIKQALSCPFRELFPPSPGQEIERVLRDALRERKSTTYLFSMEKRCKVRYFEMNVYPTENGLSVLARDITARKRADELQKSQEEMKRQLAQGQEYRILGQLTSGVAHEVRNPLNAISVVMEALFQDLGDRAEFLPYKEHIFTHVDRLKRLMQDLLELGKPIERSKVTTFSLVELVKESVAIWKSSGPHEAYEVTLETESDEEFCVKGDPLKLQQVFMNLLENASQHSPGGTEITIVLTRAGDFCRIETIVLCRDRASALLSKELLL